MQDESRQFEQRKQDHIALALLSDNQTTQFNEFDSLSLIHDALPDLNFNDIHYGGQRFNQQSVKPFLVSSMTAGHKNAAVINRHLIEACSQSGWVMGVGSQRRELFDNKAALEWVPLRHDFPNVELFSNLGIAQVITVSLAQIQSLIEVIDAKALIIHCNPLQEVIQPEGTADFKGCWHALEQLIKQLNVPIIIKETGCGFSKSTLKRLNDIGVAAVDVSGLGGTHWGRIEGMRALNNPLRNKAAQTFANWGVTTIQSIKNAITIKPNFEVWASGGVRNGLDAAKLFALGASTVGFAKPMLEAALIDAQAVYDLMMLIEYELKIAMFCTGSRQLSDLKEKICL